LRLWMGEIFARGRKRRKTGVRTENCKAHGEERRDGQSRGWNQKANSETPCLCSPPCEIRFPNKLGMIERVELGVGEDVLEEVDFAGGKAGLESVVPRLAMLVAVLAFVGGSG